MFQIKVTENY